MNGDSHTDGLEKSYVSSESIIRIIEANHTYDLSESYVSSDQIIRIIGNGGTEDEIINFSINHLKRFWIMISLIKKKGINPQDKSTLYFPQWTRVSTIRETQLAKRMARGSTFSVGEVNGVFADFPQSIIDELLNGNAVNIGGLGTFKLKVSGKSQKEKKDVTTAGAKISVVFEPAAELNSRLNDEKEFRFVEVPTAEGQQDAEGEETPDSGTDTGTTDPSTGGGGSTNPDPDGGSNSDE